MQRKQQQRGLTLIELTVAVAIIAMLVGFGVPAVRALLYSAQSESVTRTMVQSTLDTARTLAMSHQAYVGVRFQKAYNYQNEDDLQATDQYMIFVKHTPLPTDIGYAQGYFALEGHKPIRLPSPYYVADLIRGETDQVMGSNEDVNDVDMTTFTVVFSPAGQVVIEPVRVRNVAGKKGGEQVDSTDRVFNTADQIKTLQIVPPVFLIDSQDAGRHEELSRDRLFILDRDRLKKAGDFAWEDYLEKEIQPYPIYVSPYNGQLIETRE